MTGPLRAAFRPLRRHPVASLVVIATIALGVGANTAVFCFVDAILLEPLPYPDADRLVTIRSSIGGETGPISLQDVEDIKEGAQGLFDGIAVHGDGEGGYNLSGDGPPEEIPAVLCSGNLFDVLGVRPLIGGAWPAEFDRQRNYSVVLTHGLWQRRWGGDPGILDATLSLDGLEGYRIYGVMPPGFRYPGRQELFRSIAFYDLVAGDRSRRFYYGLGRLSPGASLPAAAEALRSLSRRLELEFPDTNAGVRFEIRPLEEHYVGETRSTLLLLLSAVGSILLIAGANVANILLARTLGRRRELAVRAALGAGRWRLGAQVLTESLILSVAGGIAGAALAFAWVDLLQASLGADLPPWMEVRVDARVLLFTLGITVIAGLVAGLLPSIRAARLDVRAELGAGSRSTGSRHRLARWLVVGEVSLAIVLLFGALLVVRSFRSLMAADPGFDPDRLLTFQVRLGWKAYEEAARSFAFWRALLERLDALPGVEAASLSSSPPYTEPLTNPISLEGQSIDEQQRNPWISYIYVDDDYFRTMGIPLLAGRGFDRRDTPDGQRVTVVSRATAERLWPGENPLGKRIKFDRPDSRWPWMEVVGVVGGVRHRGVTEAPGLELYVSPFQNPYLSAYLVLRTSLPPLSLAKAAEQTVLSIDPDQSSYDFVPMRERMTAAVWQRRLASRLFGLFAALAVSLTAVGLYGLLDHAVRERRREIGVRMALGAAPAAMVRAVLGDALRLVGAGAVLGSLAWLAIGRAVRVFLFDVGPFDPATLSAALCGAAAIAILAALPPALRAASVDPLVALGAD
jgi:putative ABC transport system permease protein